MKSLMAARGQGKENRRTEKRGKGTITGKFSCLRRPRTSSQPAIQGGARSYSLLSLFSSVAPAFCPRGDIVSHNGKKMFLAVESTKEILHAVLWGEKTWIPLWYQKPKPKDSARICWRILMSYASLTQKRRYVSFSPRKPPCWITSQPRQGQIRPRYSEKVL